MVLSAFDFIHILASNISNLFSISQGVFHKCMLTNCLRFKVSSIKILLHFSFSCSKRPVEKEGEEEPVDLEKTAYEDEPINVELEEIASLMKTEDVPNDNQADNCKNTNQC